MSDDEKIAALRTLWETSCKTLPYAWRYPEKWGVKGFMGVSPVAIVSCEPSTDWDFTSVQAKNFYEFLVKHHQENAHLMDFHFVNMDHHLIGGDSESHARVCRDIFQRQIDIVQPRL